MAPRYSCQPQFEKTDLFFCPPEEDPTSRAMVVIAPCVCGNNHTWSVAIPPDKWEMILRIGDSPPAVAE